jgi:tetratricopeptide (TPR) repeat protein
MSQQVRQKMGLIGLQRTGTNYVQQVLKAAVEDIDFTDHLAWKHSFRDEAGDAPIDDKVVIVARHPVLWLQSCLLNSAKDIRQNRSEFFTGDVDPIVGFANIYNRFYAGWLEHKRTAGGYLLRYEDVVESGSAILRELLPESYNIIEISHELPTLPQSVQLSSEDLKAVVNRECALSKDVVMIFWAHISTSVSSDLSYTFDEINFSESYADRQKLRSAAYKLAEKPNALTQEEFELLRRDGKDSFGNDGLVLGQIGTKLMNGGDVEGAFDWLSHAVLAIQRNDAKVFGHELDSRMADYLELLSKACLSIRERKLENLLRHYTRVNPKEDHYRAGKEYNLSLCWTKLGKADLAIEHASRAIEFADRAPTRKGDVVWWIHYLGDLLAKAGKQSQAIEKFREAAVRDPSDFRHHYRLAQEYRRLKDRERMFDSLNEAMRLRPDDVDIVGFKVTALRDFDPGNPDIVPMARRWVQLKPSDGFPKFCLSDELRKAGQIHEAIELAQACAKSNPEVAWHHHHLADLLVLESRWDPALAAIDEAILLEPKRAMHHRLRGEILLKMQRLDEARNSLETVVRCGDARAEDFHLLGRICALSGDRPVASGAFEKAIALEPKNEAHREALREVLAERGAG